jgi:hypothetical protein
VWVESSASLKDHYSVDLSVSLLVAVKVDWKAFLKAASWVARSVVVTV